MKTRRRTCISPQHLTTVRGAIAATAARFSARLPAGCMEDVMQTTFLNLWRSQTHRAFNRLPYVRRAAANTAIDFLRREGAQKRSLSRYQTFDLVRALWQPPRTPEEILMEREEAYRLLARDRLLRTRVERLMRQVPKRDNAPC